MQKLLSFKSKPKAKVEVPKAETKESPKQEEQVKMTAKIAIIYYSMYGHIKDLAQDVAEGIRSSGAEVDIYQVPETLPAEVLKKMGAPEKDATVPIATPDILVKYDGLMFGVPTRFGMAAAQMKAFLDSTGGLWSSQALSRKTAGVFFSTGSQGGGQETTALTLLTQFVHHGMIFVPLGYTHPEMTNVSEIKGGSPYGAGTITASDGSRKISAIERSIAKAHGARFGSITNSFVAGGLK